MQCSAVVKSIHNSVMMMNRQFYVFFRITANEPSFNSLGSWLVEWIVEPQLLLCHIIDTAYVDGSCGLWTPSLFVKFRSLPWGEQNLLRIFFRVLFNNFISFRGDFYICADDKFHPEPNRWISTHYAIIITDILISLRDFHFMTHHPHLFSFRNRCVRKYLLPQTKLSI